MRAAGHALVVLGAAIDAWGRPRAALRARLDTACRAYAEGKACRIIVTGHGESGPMSRYLVGHGVPESVIAREDHARSTRQNAIFVARMVPEHVHLIVVTQGSHLPRALGLFRAEHLSVEGIAAEERWGVYPQLRERVAFRLHALMGWVR